jgi:2-dehydropantoate 2-reductase
MTEPRILIVGAGAVGGYFGGRLVQAGRDATFLTRDRRAEQLRSSGLALRTLDGDATFPVKTVTAATLQGDWDLVLLAVKSFALESALDDLAPAVGEGTLVLPTLNGMRHLDLLDERFGAERVLGGACVVFAQLEPDGGVRQLRGTASLAYGLRNPADSRDLTAIHAALGGAGFANRLSTTITLDMWEKWILLAAGGALTCLLRGSVGQIVAAGGSHIARALLDECSAVAAAHGYPPRAEYRDWAEARLTEAGSGFTTSMYRDLVKGAPLEADQIVGDLVARAGAADVAVPTLALAKVALRVYQSSQVE